MPTLQSLSSRKRFLAGTYFSYAIFCLISMATMSIGAAMIGIGFFVFFWKRWNQHAFVQFINDTHSPGQSVANFRTTVAQKPMRKVFLYASATLALTLIASLISGIFFPIEFGGHSSEVHLLKDSTKIWYLFWPIVLVFGLYQLDESIRRKILNTWIVVFTVLSVIGIAQHFTGWPRPQTLPSSTDYFHTTLFLGHHLSVASVLIFPTFAALDFTISSCSKKNYLLACLYGLSSFCGLIALMLTFSRTAWIAVPFAFALWILIQLPKKVRLWALLVIFVSGLLAFQTKIVQDRLGMLIGIEDRVNLWKANLEMFQLRPLFGAGYGHNQELSGYYLIEKLGENHVFSGHAHNNILEVLAGMGLFGCLSWLSWSGLVLFLPFWNYARNGFLSRIYGRIPAGWFCAWVAFQINGLTQVNAWEGKVQHQMAWAIAWLLL